jgi:hypothetical protein
MGKRIKKIVQGSVLGVLLVATPSFKSNMVLANTRTPQKAQAAKETVTKFLSSVKLVGNAYDFDHNGDGLIDMSVYPLKTENPDLKTKYLTLEEAINKKQLILRENPKLSDIQEDFPSSFSIFAQYVGSGRPYYPRGGMLGGGWQSRGFSRGGVMGRGYGRDYRDRGYGVGYRGYRGYSNFGNNNPEEISLKEINFGDTRNIENLKIKRDKPERLESKIDVLCVEEWRLIEESRMRGEPEFFSYAGMASPFVRKELILFPNQKNIHKIIAKELRRLNVYSRTNALTDVFENQDIKEVIDYYIANSKNVLDKNKGISGMIVTDGSKILCADIYSSPDLFRKMFSQLMQSAALGVCKTRGKGRNHLGQGEVEKFLYEIKQVQKLKKESLQTYRLCVPRLVSGAVFYSDENGTKLVHLEAYPRS